MKPRKLTQWRKAQGMSKRGFAQWCGRYGVRLDAAQVSRWEAGQRFPRDKTIWGVSALTGLRFSDLARE